MKISGRFIIALVIAGLAYLLFWKSKKPAPVAIQAPIVPPTPITTGTPAPTATPITPGAFAIVPEQVPSTPAPTAIPTTTAPLAAIGMVDSTPQPANLNPLIGITSYNILGANRAAIFAKPEEFTALKLKVNDQVRLLGSTMYPAVYTVTDVISLGAAPVYVLNTLYVGDNQADPAGGSKGYYIRAYKVDPSNPDYIPPINQPIAQVASVAIADDLYTKAYSVDSIAAPGKLSVFFKIPGNKMGLKTGDQIRISGTSNYPGTYTIENVINPGSNGIFVLNTAYLGYDGATLTISKV